MVDEAQKAPAEALVGNLASDVSDAAYLLVAKLTRAAVSNLVFHDPDLETDKNEKLLEEGREILVGYGLGAIVPILLGDVWPETSHKLSSAFRVGVFYDAGLEIGSASADKVGKFFRNMRDRGQHGVSGEVLNEFCEEMREGMRNLRIDIESISKKQGHG